MTNKKIHITLIGGQLMPVFKGIIHSDPDMTYLIHTAQSKSDAEWISQQLDHDYELIQTDTTDISKIRNDYDQFLPNEGTIAVDITPATKPMAIALYEKYRQVDNATIFYLDQSNTYVDFKKGKSEKIDISLTIEQWILLHKSQLRSSKNLLDFENVHYEAVTWIRSIQPQFGKEFANLMAQFRSIKYPKDAHNVVKKVGSSTAKYDHLKDCFKFSLENKNDAIKNEIAFKDIFKFLVHTQWFELEVATMLDKWKGINQILLSCEYPYFDDSPKNEIDIVIERDNRILAFEVKTSLYDVKDIDKFQNAVKHYFGTSATPFLITDQPLKAKQLEKCNDRNVNYICLSELRKKGSDLEGTFLDVITSKIANNNRE